MSFITSWENVCLVKKFDSLSFKCKLAHNLIRFFISTRTSKHKANRFLISSLLLETAEQIKKLTLS